MSIESLLPEAVRSRYAVKLFGVAAVIVLLLTALSTTAAIQVSDRVTDEQLHAIETNAELEANALAQWVAGNEETVRMLSNHEGLTPVDRERATATLNSELAAMSPEAASLSLVERTPNGFSTGTNETIIASTEPSFVGEPLSVTDVNWKPTVGFNFDSEDDTVLSWVYTDGPEPFVAIASPTPDGDHVLVAEYRTSVRAESFASAIPETKTQVLGGFTAYVLFDRNESNVITEYEGDRVNTTIGSIILNSAATTELNGSMMTDTSIKGYHGVPGEQVDWVVVKEAPRSSALALTEQIQADIATLIGLMLLGFLLIGVVIQRGPIRAIQQLARQADAISNGDLSAGIEDTGRIDEIGAARSAFENTKSYIETITRQAEALSNREFDSDALTDDIPGRVGDSIETMHADLDGFITELERERERYSTLVEQSNDGVAVVQDGCCVFVNERLCAITGYDTDALLDRPLAELVVELIADQADDAADTVADRIDSVVADGATAQFEVAIETRNGITRRLGVAVSRIDHEGAPAALINCRDRTEQRRRERAVTSLQAATDRMQTAETPADVAAVAVEAASDVLDLPAAVCWFHDEETDRLEPVAATAAARELDLVDARDADSTAYAAFETGDVANETPGRQAMAGPLETGVLLPLGEYGLLAAGDEDWAATDGVVRDIAEVLAEHTETALDRADRAQRVRESERRFRLIADRIDEVIILATGDLSAVLYANPAYESIWGQPVDALYDDPTGYLDAIADRDRDRVERRLSEIVADIEAGEPADSYSFEYQLVRPDGDLRWVNLAVYPVELPDGGQRCIGIADDITERKRREQRLEVFNRILRHNLRNHLDVIKSHAEALADHTGDHTVDDATTEHADAVLDATNMLASMGNRARRIDQLMSRAIQPTEVDLTALIESILADCEADAAATDRAADDIEITTDLPEDASLVTDRETLQAVLESPLENAVEHAETAVEVRVSVAATDGTGDADAADHTDGTAGQDGSGDHSGGYTVVIDDDGPGIPAAELDSIQAGTETPLRHGRGLGLWQLKWGVDKLNGDFSFGTTDGTTVRITIPQFQAASDD